MKQLICKYFITASIVLLLVGCKKSEPTAYTQPDMVYIYKVLNATTNDSTTYSFATKPNSLMEDTVKIPLRIMGVAKNTDREVNVGIIADSTSALANQHYTLLPTIVKAGEYTSNIQVLVKRAASLKTTEVKLMLEVKESADFKPGIPSTIPVSPRAGGNLRYKVKLNDILTKPANWDQYLTSFFGTYSKVKYLYIIAVTGKSDFAYAVAGGLSSGEMQYYNIMLKTELAQYVAANGPMLDENGTAVTFP